MYTVNDLMHGIRILKNYCDSFNMFYLRPYYLLIRIKLKITFVYSNNMLMLNYCYFLKCEYDEAK